MKINNPNKIKFPILIRDEKDLKKWESILMNQKDWDLKYDGWNFGFPFKIIKILEQIHSFSVYFTCNDNEYCYRKPK